jgi:hypothetical protein
MAFVHLRPRYFAEIMANLLFWLGPDKLCFGKDYAIWSPKWLIEKFMAFDQRHALGTIRVLDDLVLLGLVGIGSARSPRSAARLPCCQ